MKYRIMQINNGDGFVFYPQYKSLLFWHNFKCSSPYGRMSRKFYSMIDATNYIKNRKKDDTIGEKKYYEV